jgi:tetratricopeptide (TPR) repeat protein
VKTIARTAEQMGDLMAQLSRRSPGHGRVAPLEVAELVAATLRSLGPEAGVALEIEGEPGQVLAVPEQLQQVLLNLVLNAKRAVERDGAKAPVRVCVTRSLDRVRLGSWTRRTASRRSGCARCSSRSSRARRAGSGSASTSRNASWNRTGARCGWRRGRARDARGGGAAGGACACGRADFGCEEGEHAMKRRAAWAVVLVAAFSATGCGLLNDFRKTRHTKASNRYVAEKKWKEATIEFRTALRYDPQNIELVKGLGLAFFDNGQLGEAYPPLQRYHHAHPEDLEVRQKLGVIYLMGRAPDKAREQAEAILKDKPQDLDAMLLLAESSDTPEEVKDSIARIEQNRAALGDPDRVSRALGMLYVKNQDVPRAEQEFKGAVSSKPDSPEAHLALARLHLAKKELAEAEKEFKAAAAVAPAGSYARLQLADFYLLTRRVDEAVKELTQITNEAPDAFPAWLRLAEVAFAQGKLDDAQKAVDAVLTKSADNASALILQTRILLAKRETAKAVETAQKAVKAQPSNGLSYYMLALAQVAAGNSTAALAAARDAVARRRSWARRRCGVRAGAAVGRHGGCGRRAQGLPGAGAERRPRLGGARQGRSCARGTWPAPRRRSTRPWSSLRRTAARSWSASAARAGQVGEAKQQFEKALVMAPGFVGPLDQLAAMSLAEKNPQAAVARRAPAMLEPKSAAIQYLLGRSARRAATPGRERAFRKSVSSTPAPCPPTWARPDLRRLEGGTTGRSPNSTRRSRRGPTSRGAHAQSIAQQMKGDNEKAREGYEAAQDNPRFAPAGNNLAWMLAEDGPGQDLKRAMLLAQAARDAAPQDPQIADTLGWVHYKQGAYPAAEALLREAAEKLPTNPDVLYHLGMAQAKVGRNEEARASLAKSLELSANHAGAADARATLASLPPRAERGPGAVALDPEL